MDETDDGMDWLRMRGEWLRAAIGELSVLWPGEVVLVKADQVWEMCEARPILIYLYIYFFVRHGQKISVILKKKLLKILKTSCLFFFKSVFTWMI